MTPFELVGITIGLAMDAFAVAIASSIALGRVRRQQVFRVSFHFGIFHVMMPVIGWLLGRSFHHLIQTWDHWVAFLLLVFIGGKALFDLGKSDGKRRERSDPTQGASLIILSIATSIDALAVGLGLAFLDVVIWYPAVVIGLVATAFTTFGMLLGSRLGMLFGRRVEMMGGLVLIAIGFKIMIEHLTS